MPRFLPEDIQPGAREPGTPDIKPRVFYWRVRVIERREAWVDVEATDAASAERAASGQFGIVSVFPGSALRADLGEPRSRFQDIEGATDE